MNLTDHDDDRLNGDPPDFLAALNMGDVETAVLLLRQISSLTAAQITELANILSPEQSLALDYPYTLKLVRRVRGRPRNLRRDINNDAITNLILTQNIQEYGKVEAALHATAVESGLKLSTVRARVRRHRKRKSSKT